MSSNFFLAFFLVAVATALPRFRRDVTYGPCKNTYDQCSEWKTQGWCGMDQYKEYMATVCPVTCELCRESSPEQQVAHAVESSTATADSAQAAYQAQLQQYYANVQQQQAEYAAQTAAQTATQTTTDSQTADSTSSYAAAADATPLQTPENAPQIEPAASSAASEPAAASDDASTEPKPEPAPASGPASTSVPAASSATAPATADVPEPAAAVSKVANIQNSAVHSTTNDSQKANTAEVAAKPKLAEKALPTFNVQNGAQVSVPSQNTLNQQGDDSKPYNVEQTSSALYSNNNNTVKPKPTPEQVPAAKQNAKEDDSTNEKFKTESKHLEKAIANKQLQNSKGNKKLKYNTTVSENNENEEEQEQDEEGSTKEETNEAEEAEEANTTEKEEASTTEKEDDNEDDEEEQEVKQKKHSGTTLNTTKRKYNPKVKSTSKPTKESYTASNKENKHESTETQKQKTAYNSRDVKSNKLNNKSVTRPNKFSSIQQRQLDEDEMEDYDDDDYDESAGTESGSGAQGELEDALAKDLEELSFITSLNFDDDDYDVGDDLTNEIAILDSKKNFIKNDKAAELSHPGAVHARSEIDVPETNNVVSTAKSDASENEESSGSESGDSESGVSEDEKQKTLLETMQKNGDLKAFSVTKNENKSVINSTAKEEKSQSSTKNTISKAAEESGEESGTSEDDGDDDADDAEDETEEASARDEENKSKDHKKLASDFLPDDLLPATAEERKEKEEKEFGNGSKQPEGKISIVLKQNFNTLYKDPNSANYQMLSGNVKKDFEKMLKGSKVTDISFSEAIIEGNPRQTGKTKVSFNIDSSDKNFMKSLIKLVDEGNINGLSIVKSSLETDD